MPPISRREFVSLAVASTVVSRVASPFARRLDPRTAAITAGEIVERIKQHIGVSWNVGTAIDTFKAGGPSTAVTGIVTTSMATLDVLQRAAAAGANFVITAAPTFYSRADARSLPARGAFGAGGARGARRGGGPGAGRAELAARGEQIAHASGPGTGASAPMPPVPPLPASVVPPPSRGSFGAAPATTPAPDRVYAGKNAFIDAHALAIFRLSEHWNARKPDPRAVGLAAAAGWTRYAVGGDALRYEVPPTRLDALASHLKTSLGIRGGMRAIGKPETTVRRIGLLPGLTAIAAAVAMMPTVDVIVAGEVVEWETPTYVQDVVFAGLEKGFISIGRVVDEAQGMQVCADWLRALVPEVPVRFIPAGDPYWRPL
jgi:putative NIF3 family GTP cyclohydrolase 1 type 2